MFLRVKVWLLLSYESASGAVPNPGNLLLRSKKWITTIFYSCLVYRRFG